MTTLMQLPLARFGLCCFYTTIVRMGCSICLGLAGVMYITLHALCLMLEGHLFP